MFAPRPGDADTEGVLACRRDGDDLRAEAVRSQDAPPVFGHDQLVRRVFPTFLPSLPYQPAAAAAEWPSWGLTKYIIQQLVAEIALVLAVFEAELVLGWSPPMPVADGPVVRGPGLQCEAAVRGRRLAIGVVNGCHGGADSWPGKRMLPAGNRSR